MRIRGDGGQGVEEQGLEHRRIPVGDGTSVRLWRGARGLALVHTKDTDDDDDDPRITLVPSNVVFLVIDAMRALHVARQREARDAKAGGRE